MACKRTLHIALRLVEIFLILAGVKRVPGKADEICFVYRSVVDPLELLSFAVNLFHTRRH